MLYYFYSVFHINIFQYITVRAGIAFFFAFFFTLYLMPKFIRWAMKKSSYQPIYSLAPEHHKKKANTPTMGGVVFIFSALLASLLTVKIHNPYVLGAFLTILGFLAIGVIDDYGKITKRSNQSGLSAKKKFFLQILVAFLVSLYLYGYAHLSTDLYVPFYKYPLFDMNISAVLFWTLVIVATSNAVNLTDGLDGLATVPSIMALTTLAIITYITGNAVLSHYLLLPKIIGVGEVSIVAAAFAGSLIGFLWYNCHPAEVFMGDSGSLTLGAFIGYMAIISKSEILLILIGFVFVMEALSVIIQVSSFKLRKKRVFLMAPIHHHFEQKNWNESKIIVRFWIIALISNLIALITLKIR
ncbi:MULTISPECIES: phospho-N-acetylmuramoyl-pentapeptide-transferase [unclassified Nitratiruptor]|uniref:phospho-N-acetylmuramoyl-pentapeptide- transferase n=1 Tax=unclassified Nitratiruptor TaxID=2624044 RepID=UPI001916861F|nr:MULTISPECIES: phospho-N-acetylmuramoyl-pentapeptide-transferase [unclassified Nitratiruptor]BCD59645.1 phospho-N-acetylmuramoyl-pentapeptide-transferase [Nitratiruptor sp. YY08-10]BCD63569.1 phospho-N-acetylmuramoyl-pentapeptide-transferase [Nitratiruptor sp. YY08-14]